MTSTSPPFNADPADVEGPAVVWIHPRGWQTDNRTRRYISLTERCYSREADCEMLRRSVDLMLKEQDPRGAFYSDEQFCQGDVTDDQLGACALLAYELSQGGQNETPSEALERGVRFFLDHLVHRSPERPTRYSRFYNDRDSSHDWGNALWSAGHGSAVLRYGTPFLTKRTAAELRDLLAELWQFVSTYPVRDENPCHNQLLAYCEIGILLGAAIGEASIKREVLEYYHVCLRPCRVQDRGHLIYGEFGEWDIHYGVLSWMILERLFVLTGVPAFREDSDAIALYFNEQTSAGGYYWGGSRNNECGVDEFPQLFTARDAEFGFGRLLFPEPSHLWRRMTVNGHAGLGLIARIETTLPSRKEKRLVTPTAWHFQDGDSSACLLDDTRMHHVSSAGFEIISAPSPGGVAPGLRWRDNSGWREDLLQVRPPKPTRGLSYAASKPIQPGIASGITSMQRGYFWETRQWWLGTGGAFLWVGQLITHAFPRCDEIHFVLGAPVLTRLSGRPVPVCEVETAAGDKVDTQGDAVTVFSPDFLRFGDVFVGATAPLAFVRPSKNAFHTFPIPLGRLWRDCPDSNELRVCISSISQKLECRVSLFFAVEIGTQAPALKTSTTQTSWSVRSRIGTFAAGQSDGVWSYALENESARAELPHASFGQQSS